MSQRSRPLHTLSIKIVTDDISSILIDKLFNGVRFNPNGKGCWVRGNDSTIYTTISIDGKQIRASRLAYKLFNGHYPHKLACHTCDTPACINPDHILDKSDNWNFKDALSKNLVGNSYLGRTKDIDKTIDYYKNTNTLQLERI